MNSRAMCVVVLQLTACQCLVPVDERDAGGGAGGRATAGGSTAGGAAMGGGATGGGAATAGGSTGGGATAGGTASGTDAGVQCTTAAECPTPQAFQFCQFPTPACVNGSCLMTCGGPPDGGLACRSATETCLTCNGSAACAQCRTFRCVLSAQPVLGACAPPFHDARNFEGVQLAGSCGLSLVPDGGASAGRWYGTLTGPGGALFELIDLPALGGTCIGSDLGTQVPRTVVSCPGCTFIAEGC